MEAELRFLALVFVVGAVVAGNGVAVVAGNGVAVVLVVVVVVVVVVLFFKFYFLSSCLYSFAPLPLVLSASSRKPTQVLILRLLPNATALVITCYCWIHVDQSSPCDDLRHTANHPPIIRHRHGQSSPQRNMIDGHR